MICTELFYSYLWASVFSDLVSSVLKTKQFFVQFLTSIKILIMFITQTTKSMKINALQILIKPPYLINFLLQWLLMMQQVLSIATSKLEAFQRDDFKHIKWYSLEVWYLETSFCFFQSWDFFPVIFDTDNIMNLLTFEHIFTLILISYQFSL